MRDLGRCWGEDAWTLSGGAQAKWLSLRSPALYWRPILHSVALTGLRNQMWDLHRAINETVVDRGAR